MTRVFITGVSSFIGCHIARRFVSRGYSVKASLTRRPDDYLDALAVQRLQYSGVTDFVYQAPFGSAPFVEALKDWGPKVFLNIGAPIKGYRAPTFDADQCSQLATHNIGEVVAILKSTQANLLHASSIFEAIESRNLTATSPYGLAKTHIWRILRDAYPGPIRRVVVPDPVGRFENLDRMGPAFFRAWKAGKNATLFNPEQVWDRVPADWIAQVFLNAAEDFDSSVSEYFPSAFSESNRKWATRLSNLYRAVNPNAEATNVNEVPSVSSPRVNTEKRPELNTAAEGQFFESYANWLNQSIII